MEIEAGRKYRIPHITILEDYHVLQDRLSFYISGFLSLVWVSLQLRKYLTHNPNAGCWIGWDAIGLACMAYFCQQQHCTEACVFTSAFFVWTRLPGGPLNDFYLPSFGAFLESCSEDNTTKSGTLGGVQVSDALGFAPACLVRWSSDGAPIALLCDHLICRDCLATMKVRRQPCCPMCRRLLFHNNDGLRCAIHKAVTTALAARMTAFGICLALQLWHGQYWDVFKAFVTFIPQLYGFRVLHKVVLMQGVEWWQFGVFDYLLVIPVPEWRFLRSVWPAAVLSLIFSFNVLNNLRQVRWLDRAVERVVYQEPSTYIDAS